VLGDMMTIRALARVVIVSLTARIEQLYSVTVVLIELKITEHASYWQCQIRYY